jgi:hypothetical protein
VGVPVLVRRVTADDIPWIMRISEPRYPPAYDRPGTEQWIRNAVLPNPIMWFPIRTDDAFLFAMLNVNVWLPNDIEVNVMVMVADKGGIWQLPTLLRESIKWAKHRRAVRWHAQSDTEHELGPLMRRIGAKLKPSYVMEL